MPGNIEAIFFTPRGGVDMKQVEEIEALANCGLRDDRYCLRTGYWTGVDECQVTLIEAEDLEEIERATGIQVGEGQHRRNLVTRGIRLESLRGKQFQIGEAVLRYDRPRPPCLYLEAITEPGMTRALVGRGGICARVVRSGWVHAGDNIDLIQS